MVNGKPILIGREYDGLTSTIFINNPTVNFVVMPQDAQLAVVAREKNADASVLSCTYSYAEFMYAIPQSNKIMIKHGDVLRTIGYHNNEFTDVIHNGRGGGGIMKIVGERLALYRNYIKDLVTCTTAGYTNFPAKDRLLDCKYVERTFNNEPVMFAHDPVTKLIYVLNSKNETVIKTREQYENMFAWPNGVLAVSTFGECILYSRNARSMLIKGKIIDVLDKWVITNKYLYEILPNNELVIRKTPGFYMSAVEKCLYTGEALFLSCRCQTIMIFNGRSHLLKVILA